MDEGGDIVAPFVSPGAGELPEAAFRMIVDGTAYPFVVIDRSGVIRYAGGSVEELLGWAPAALVGRNMAEFINPDHLEVAAAALTELEQVNRTGAGVPMVFGVLRPDATTAWVEVGAMPLLDLPDFDAVVLRHRPWDATHHFDGFLEVLLAGEPVDAVLVALGRAVALSLQADGAAVHHGFDGLAFADAAGWGVPVACLAPAGAPWCEVAATGEASVAAVSDLPGSMVADAAALGLQVCWCVPVPPSEGLAPAVLTVWRSAPGGPFIGHRHMLTRISRFVQLALVRSAEQERLRHLAGHDSLTGVANRGHFRERLAHALAIGERDLAVAFCDLDGFKPVNDRYGHRAGDAVLVEPAV